MATLAARCPNCKTVFKLKDASLAGKKIKCRKCQTPFVVQAANTEHDGYGHIAESNVDPYGRDVAFVKPGVLPVSGRKIRKIEKVVEAEKPEAEQEGSIVPGGKKRRRRKGETNVKKKKKKKKAATTQNQKMIAIGGGLTLLVLIIVGAIYGPTIAKRISNSGKLEPPKKYLVYEPQDSELTIEYPEGWDISHGGGSANKLSFIRINYSGVEVFIVEFDPEKEAMNAALTGGPSQFGEPGKAPSYSVHLRRLKEIQETNSDFEESPPQEIETGLGIAQYSSFTDPGFFGTTTGYRMTIYDPDGGKYNAYFRCGPKQFDAAKPIFQHMMGSIGLANVDDDEVPGL